MMNAKFSSFWQQILNEYLTCENIFGVLGSTFMNSITNLEDFER
jgi:hypothetical protein